MARREIHNELDRENRNNHNENYKELYNKLNELEIDPRGSVSEIVVFDDVEIRDTDWHRGNVSIDLDEYDLIILNETDVPFKMLVSSYTDYFRHKSTRVFNGDSFIVNEYDIMRTTTLQYLPFDQIRIRGKIAISVSASKKPTSGRFSILLLRR